MIRKQNLLVIFFAALLLAGHFFSPQVFSETGFKNPVSRIVSLSPSTTEILFALGAGDQVAGVTTYCNTPAEARLKPKAGGFTQQSLETIAVLKPDLVVVTPSGGSKMSYERLENSGIPVLSLPFYSLKDLSQAFEKLGNRTGKTEEAQAWIARLESAAESIRAQSDASRRARVLYVTWREPLIVSGSGTLEDEILSLSGSLNAAAGSKTRYPRWSEESLWTSDPDVILDTSAFEREGSPEKHLHEAREFWARFKKMRAVKEGKVFVFHPGSLPVPGPRTPVQMEMIAAILKNPEVVPNAEQGYERLVF